MHLPDLLVPLLTLLPFATAAAVAATHARFPYLVVANSNCGCKRDKQKFCFEYTEYNVTDNKCYNISGPSHGMKMYSPWVLIKRPVVCAVFGDYDCKGRTQKERAFDANWACQMGASVDDEYWHNSFKCRHEDW
ncbi:Fc.00g071720.m01.CDS01 [Cosmosporella sp. VM-42]